jgi:hypothetical protein
VHDSGESDTDQRVVREMGGEVKVEIEIPDYLLDRLADDAEVSGTSIADEIIEAVSFAQNETMSTRDFLFKVSRRVGA